MADFIRVEFVGGPLDGAFRPIQRECLEVPLAAGAVIHVYVRDEVFEGPFARQIMRHYAAIAAWRTDARTDQ
jgi:hypothetical protein